MHTCVDERREAYLRSAAFSGEESSSKHPALRRKITEGFGGSMKRLGSTDLADL